jgi:hypothetical protein
MADIQAIAQKAQKSSFYRWLLNIGLSRMVPFNKPHGFRIVELLHDSLTVLLPYKRANLNHIRGLHACALATLAEFTTGFLLVARLDPKKYRIIMKGFRMDYHFQGKLNAYASFQVNDQWLEEYILNPLRQHPAVLVDCEVKIMDKARNHLATGQITWQIKAWKEVRTQ